MRNMQSFKRSYLIGSVIVWIGILLATSITLAGTPYFAQLIPILGGGIAWFVVIIPGILYSRTEMS